MAAALAAAAAGSAAAARGAAARCGGALLQHGHAPRHSRPRYRRCYSTPAAPQPQQPGTPPPAEPVEIIFKPNDMRPRQTVAELDKFIVGQAEAKKAVAIALRNRWRRHQVPDDMKEEVTPKNILMIGPTGVGKTEVARRLAKLTDAPFVKVEATKFTEVGFHGRDVDSIIEDLLKNSVNLTKNKIRRENEAIARQRAEDRVLEALAGQEEKDSFRDHLRTGGLDDMDVTIELTEKVQPPQRTMQGEGGVSVMEISAFGQGGRSRPIKKKMKIKDALPAVEREEMDKLLDSAAVEKEALRACEEDGVVVIDEIDKIVTSKERNFGHQASAEGVQQDLLPLIEGSVVTIKNSQLQVKTDRILFICSGAFHSCSPSDMLAELQGRLPIRVELKALTEKDFYRILTEPEHNLIKQNVELMKTEGVDLVFQDEAIMEIAKIATEVNRSVQNIGARRLITVIERVVDDVSFRGPELKDSIVTIDREYVQGQVKAMLEKVDLQKFLL
eukprot:TRINITY_DN7246_c1_g2_i1.p1 TRINITY_DN7246_c1_g2~~TRINITY_DN7246_c1_g2_i1.p1  ORF type:complete len:501 (+),score=211.71 TRINITY_DN7246_c1_g2_i1:94-1596(+)